MSQLALFDTTCSTRDRRRVQQRWPQLHYTHAVPKTTEAVGERISLAFRLKPDL
jgi:hypothetical protein